MSEAAAVTVPVTAEVQEKKFRNQKLPRADFRNKDLKNADFRGCSLVYADFTGSDLSYANFEGANCHGAVFTDAKCHRTNFKDACLAHTLMDCADMYGCTITMECKSFEKMQLAPGWWYGFLFYALLMTPPSKEAEEKLIAMMGPERYRVLREQYSSRRM